jgi:histidine triad (HIT) family protein
MSCAFCDIIEGRRGADVFYEDERTIVFADIHPKANIHLLVCPKEHYTMLAEMPDDLKLILLGVVNYISRSLGIEDNFRLLVNNGALAGQIIEHMHIHFMSNARVELEYKGRG